MIVDQSIETRPTFSNGRQVTAAEVRETVDGWLADLAEQIRIEDLTVKPAVRFTAADDEPDAVVVPLPKRELLRATWGLQAAREMGDQ